MILGAFPHEHTPIIAALDCATSVLTSFEIGSILQGAIDTDHSIGTHSLGPMAAHRACVHWLLLSNAPKDRSLFLANIRQ